MFIQCRSRYTRNGQTAQGLFLMVASHPTEKFERNGKTYDRLYALGRSVKMTQCGHFMMSNMKIRNHEFCLSGSLGSDGLPLNHEKVEPIFDLFKPIPDDVAYIYWTDNTGWNSVGVSSKDLRYWAIREKSIWTSQAWVRLQKLNLK